MILYNVGLFSCCKYIYLIYKMKKDNVKINAERKSKVDDNTARMQSIKQLGV